MWMDGLASGSELMCDYLCFQQLMTLKNERSHFESQVNRLQHKLKDLNDEFQLRLVTYLKNVAVS